MGARAEQDRVSFWRGMRDGDHVCQLHADDSGFLDSLTGFVGHGLWSGEAAVIIATRVHLVGLESRLRQSGLDLAHLRREDRYITLSPQATLQQFLRDGLPDAGLCEQVLVPVIARAAAGGSAVRVFGEMVAVLWEEGGYAAAIALEQVWQKLTARLGIQLLCAYPQRDFERAPVSSRAAVRAAHGRVLAT